jgi:hypothetical protein
LLWFSALVLVLLLSVQGAIMGQSTNLPQVRNGAQGTQGGRKMKRIKDIQIQRGRAVRAETHGYQHENKPPKFRHKRKPPTNQQIRETEKWKHRAIVLAAGVLSIEGLIVRNGLMLDVGDALRAMCKEVEDEA